MYLVERVNNNCSIKIACFSSLEEAQDFCEQKEKGICWETESLALEKGKVLFWISDWKKKEWYALKWQISTLKPL